MALFDDTSTTSGGTAKSIAAPGMEDILGAGKWLFNAGQAWAPNTTSQVTPFSTQTMQALKGMMDQAGGAAPQFQQLLQQMFGTTQNPLDPLQQQQVGALKGIAQQPFNAQQQQAGNVYGQQLASPTGLNAGQQNAMNTFMGQMSLPGGLNPMQMQGANWLKSIAQGGEMKGNPFLNEVIRRGSGDIANADNLMASMAGRYGSGGHAGVLQKNLADFAGNLRFQDYNTQQQRRDAAISDYFGAGTTGYGQRTGAAGNVAGLAGTGYGQRTGAANNLAALGAQGFNQRADAIGSLYNAGGQRRENQVAAPSQFASAYQAGQSPWQTMTQVGGALEGKNADILRDQSRVFDATQQSMRAPIEWLQSLTNPYMGGGSQTNTVTSNPLANAIQGGMTGFDVFGGPMGGAFGALMSLLNKGR